MEGTIDEKVKKIRSCFYISFYAGAANADIICSE